MNCRDFISEFETRGALSQAARTHLNDCSGCRRAKIVQTHIWTAIEDFKTVDAPPDFDFRVRARIADQRTPNPRREWLPVLRYVLPTLALFSLLGWLVFGTNLFFAGDSPAPPVAQNAPASTAPTAAEILPPVAPNNAPNSAPPVGDLAQSFTNEKIVVETANLKQKPSNSRRAGEYAAFDAPRRTTNAPRRRAAPDDANGGGSRESASAAPRVLTPTGFDANRTAVAVPNADEAPTSLKVDVWEFVGIEIAAENGAPTIKTVKPGSLAARRGVRAGDVLTAINGAPVSSETLPKLNEIKSLTVRRAAERIEIKF